jgi:hypothetical protein
MACDLFAFFTWVSFVTLFMLVSHGFGDECAYPRFVESTTNAYTLGLAHGVGLLPLPFLERAFPLGNLELFLSLNK